MANFNITALGVASVVVGHTIDSANRSEFSAFTFASVSTFPSRSDFDSSTSGTLSVHVSFIVLTADWLIFVWAEARCNTASIANNFDFSTIGVAQVFITHTVFSADRA